MHELLCEIKDLKVHFFTDEGTVRAVDGVDLTIRRGRTLCLVGESGSGKSVTARTILQIVDRPGRIVGGQILFYKDQGASEEVVDVVQLKNRGRNIRQFRGKEAAMIFQEPMSSLSMSYTVGNQIIEAIRLHSPVTERQARAQAVELLSQVGIPRPDRLVDEYPFRLSGGMRQRVMIAMALSCRPKLLIADEPTTALDVTTQAQIIDLMLDLQAQYGMAILFITHDLGVVSEVADDVAVMYLGNVVEVGSADVIFDAPQHPYTQALMRSIPQMQGEKRRLDVIQGMVPSPFRRPSGCPFHPRCVHAIPGVCDQTFPAAVAPAPGHAVRCVLAQPENNHRHG